MFYWKSPKHLILRSLKLKRWLSKSKQYTLGYQKKHLCITFITSPGVNLWTYSAVKSNSKVIHLHIKKKHYSWLPITCTLANSNLMLTWTKVDFPHTFIVILPLIPRTLDNSNLLLTQFNSCFPSNNFYIIWPSKTWIMFKCVASQKKRKTVYYCWEGRSTEIISKQLWEFFIQLICSFRYRLGLCMKKCTKNAVRSGLH